MLLDTVKITESNRIDRRPIWKEGALRCEEKAGIYPSVSVATSIIALPKKPMDVGSRATNSARASATNIALVRDLDRPELSGGRRPASRGP